MLEGCIRGFLPAPAARRTIERRHVVTVTPSTRGQNATRETDKATEVIGNVNHDSVEDEI